MSEKRKITQETFDAAVKENIDEFEMNPTEALTDAISQFNALGVDLSNVVTSIPDGSSKETPSAKAKKIITELKTALESSSEEAILESLTKIKSECDISLADRCLLGSVGTSEVLFDVSKRHESAHSKVFLESLRCLSALTDGQPDVLKPEDISFLVKLLRDETDSLFLAAILRGIRNGCKKHEANRLKFVDHGLVPLLLEAVTKFRDSLEIVRLAVKTLKSLTLDDDVRVEYGRAHEHAKMIVKDHSGIGILVETATAVTPDDETTFAYVLSTLSALAVRNEFCQEIVDCGGLRLVLNAMLEKMESQNLVQAGLGLLKAIAGNDSVKEEIGKTGGINIVLNAMNKHQGDVRICHMGCACLAALALRSSNNCEAIIEAGGANGIVTAMKVHKDNVPVLKSAFRTICNLVNRKSTNGQQFLDLGVEQLINDARKKHRQLESEGKSTLTILECYVEVRELWTGEKGHLDN